MRSEGKRLEFISATSASANASEGPEVSRISTELSEEGELRERASEIFGGLPGREEEK